MDKDDEQASTVDATDYEPGEGGSDVDELGILISAWLFDPAISDLFEAQKYDEALERAGLPARNDLVAKLQGIDAAKIQQLVQTLKRPLVRPMS